MKPYYQDDRVTLYHGDCLEVNEWLTADVLLTDPPYGMSFVSGRIPGVKRPIAADDAVAVRDEVLQLWGSRSAAVFGTWKTDRPKGVEHILIWDKRGAGPGMGDLTAAFGTSHEEIYLIGEWKKRGSRLGSVITTESSPSALTTKIGHPTPKPLRVMEILVSASVGVVADPFAGSGSTLLAARNLGRRAIGVELEERYCEIIATRLNQMCLDFDREA